VVADRGRARGAVTLIYNPFYHVADNIGSVWMARAAMDRDFLLLNGDTLVPPALIERLVAASPGPVCVAVDQKAEYDADDMKVRLDGVRIVRIDKGLDAGECDAESIGCLRFSTAGGRAFIDTIEALLRTPEGTNHFYLRAVDRLADQGLVTAAGINGLEWAEVDYPADLAAARALTERWRTASAAGGPVRAKPGA
jgi:choline kinase